MFSEIRNNHILELYIETNEVNSLNKDFFKTFSIKLDSIAKDRTIKAVILTSKNENFSRTVLIRKFLSEKPSNKFKTLCVLLWIRLLNTCSWKGR